MVLILCFTWEEREDGDTKGLNGCIEAKEGETRSICERVELRCVEIEIRVLYMKTNPRLMLLPGRVFLS